MKINKRGITVISILVIVVVLSILSTAIVISSNSILMYTYKKEFYNEYYLIQSAVNDYIKRNSGIVDFEETSINMTTINQKYLNQFDSENIENNRIEAYIIDLDKIGINNATYGNKINGDQTDVYVITKKNHTVYYMKGFSNSDFVYYKVIED